MQRIIGLLMVVCALFAVLAVTGCGSKSFAGKWKPVKMTMGNQTMDTSSQKNQEPMEIKKSGSGYVMVAGGKETPLTEKDGKLSFTDPSGGMTTDITLDSKTDHLIMKMSMAASPQPQGGGLGNAMAGAMMSAMNISVECERAK